MSRTFGNEEFILPFHSKKGRLNRHPSCDGIHQPDKFQQNHLFLTNELSIRICRQDILCCFVVCSGTSMIAMIDGFPIAMNS
jgi:hypothetical protein